MNEWMEREVGGWNEVNITSTQLNELFEMWLVDKKADYYWTIASNTWRKRLSIDPGGNISLNV